MSSELNLHFAGIFLSYSLQIAAAYLGCWLLNRLLPRPQQRFVVWMALLLAAVTYWLGLIAWQLRALAGSVTIAGNAKADLSTLDSRFLVPLGWSRAILVSSEVFVIVYLTFVIALIAVALWRHRSLRLFLQQGRPASDAIASLFDRTRCDHGVSRCELAVFANLASPATAGWLRPRILLPAICEKLGPTPQLADALHHEMVHVARHDYLWSGLSALICRLLFFHPAVWYAKKHIRMQAELACDLAVIESCPEHRADYADSLAAFVRLRMVVEQTTVGIDFAATSSLRTRIRFILSEPKPLHWWKRASRAAAALAVMVMFAIVAPALTIFLNFDHPLRQGASIPQTAVRPLHDSHEPKHRGPAASAQDLARIQAQPWIPETTAYTLTSSSRPTSATEPASELDRPWRESPQSMKYPSVSNVLISTVGVALGRGRDRDKDDHDKRSSSPQ
ncbi:MAG: M56 family metallopeptidase [Candidatus Angelobacter sp.]